MTASALSEIRETKKQFLWLVTGEYLITGFFWVFAALGSLALKLSEQGPASDFFFTFFVFMFSNGIWEILTGWYADKFRRRLSLSAGFLACLAGFCLMGAAAVFHTETYVFFVWNAGITIWSLGPALLSGAQEAWLVDRCNFYSPRPPEDVDDTFKKSAAYGILAKSIGAAVCFLIFVAWGNIGKPQGQSAILAFVSSAIIAGVVSAALLVVSLRLREEYWEHPKYQTEESLFIFLWEGLKDLCKPPFLWFAIGYLGFMCLNYVQSSTVWAYLENTETMQDRLLVAGAILIAAELAGSLLSRPFSKWIDLIRQQGLRLPVASLAYLAPLPFLFMFWRESSSGQEIFLGLLIVATFLFRTSTASVFGSLNTVGQLAIKSDERRAILISMASAISSFTISLIFYLFHWSARLDTAAHLDRKITYYIERFWLFVPLPFILILALGGYLVARSRKEVK